MWSEIEIVKNYREAKHKKAQIKILSELNACSQEQIKEILLRNGYEQTIKFDYPTPIKDSKRTNKDSATTQNISTDIQKREKEIADFASVIKGTSTTTVKKQTKPVNTIINPVKQKRSLESVEPKKDSKTVETPISMLISDEELIERFVVKKQTIAHIAETLGIEKHRLQKYMENHNIVRERKFKPSVSSEAMADALVADKLLDSKIKTYLDAAKRLREKAEEFEAQAKALQSARDAISGDIGKDLGTVLSAIIKGASE